MKRLRFLNLGHNPLCKQDEKEESALEESEESEVDRFEARWPIELQFEHLNILILNSCFINLDVVERLLERLPNLIELHLASNNYSKVDFSPRFIKNSIEILYFNSNNLTNWNEVCKLGKCFPRLKNLVISHNDIENFTSNLATNKCFQRLEILIMNKLKIDDWSIIDQLSEFPHLKHVRVQNIPLLNPYNDEEKYYLLVSHLSESIISLNGSEISDEDRENCERKYIRHYIDSIHKPKRYLDLERKHGKLNKLADVRLEGQKLVHVKIKFREAQVFEKVDVRQTVGDFKKQLEKFVGHPASRFRVFYIDIEAMSVYGPEELKYLNRCLYSFNIRDGDEFEIDLKPAASIHYSSSDQQFTTHCVNYLNNNQNTNYNLNQQVPSNTSVKKKPLVRGVKCEKVKGERLSMDKKGASEKTSYQADDRSQSLNDSMENVENAPI